MIITTRQPHPRLAPLLHGSYVGWSSTSAAAHRCRELPFPGLPLILSFGERFRLTDTRRSVPETTRIGSFLAGLDDWYTETESPRGSSAIQVNFTPVGARLLLGLPLELLTHRVVSLETLLGPEGRQLELDLGNEREWSRRFELFEAWLLRRLALGTELSAEVQWIWRELETSRGTTPIGRLGTALGWSRQRLVTTVRRELGMPPKLLARIVRFHSMTQRLRRGKAVNWSALAAECGYHDQSHLIHDTRDFAGCTPMELPRHLPVPPA